MYVEFQKNHICLGVNSFLRNFFKNVPRGLLVRLVNFPHWWGYRGLPRGGEDRNWVGEAMRLYNKDVW